MSDKSILIGIIIVVGILALAGLIIWQQGLLKDYGPGIACPAIAPDCGQSREACWAAAESLEESYPGCGFGEYCSSCDSGAPQPTTENPEGTVCTTIYDPVCGVDGKTYGNSCLAGVAGMEIDYQGECGTGN